MTIIHKKNIWRKILNLRAQESGLVEPPHLVVGPKSTLRNWENEVNRWCPSLKCLVLQGDREEREGAIDLMLRRWVWL
jgi:SNF2 family DNA or RNA helicase